MRAPRLLVATLTVVALALPPAHADAQAPERALLAFTLEVGGGHSEIHTMRADGSERRRVTGGSVPLSRRAPSSFDPAWSPDGGRLAFVRASDYRSSRSSIRTLDIGAGSVLTVTSGRNDYGPTWSPDGGRIAFSRGAQDGGFSIFVVAAGGGPVTRLTPQIKYRFDLDPAWAPDGSAIAFTRRTFRPETASVDQDVMIMNADGSGVRRLASQANSPAWSPDSSRIAFLSTRDRNGERCFAECVFNNELYVMDADGGNPRRLTRTRGDEERPAWSPDGARIAFDSDRNSPEGWDGGGRELYSIGSGGSCMTWLSNGGADSIDPAWQPGAGRRTDPGPGCGATARPPTHDIDISPLRSFRRFPLYWLGPQFGGSLLSSVASNDPIYWDCGSYRPSSCSLRIELQNESICRRNPFTYGGGLGGGETPSPFDALTLAQKRFAYRGAIAAFYPSSLGWDVYLGATTVAVFGVEDSKPAVKRVIRALRPVRGPARARLPAPRFPDAFWGKLRRFERAYKRTGSVRGAAHRLRVTRRAVGDKLALARLLRKLRIRRHAGC